MWVVSNWEFTTCTLRFFFMKIDCQKHVCFLVSESTSIIKMTYKFIMTLVHYAKDLFQGLIINNNMKLWKEKWICLLFTILRPFGTIESIRRKVDNGGQIVLWYWAACHKLGQGDCVRSLHEPNKSVCVGEGQGQTKTFLNFLCIWTNKEQMLFILYLPQVVASTKPLCVWHALPCT